MRDFDFWIGRWDVRNRKLRSRLTDCTEWDEYDAIAEAAFLPGDIGNIDSFTAGDFVGMTVRLYDRAKEQWAIHWADNIRGVFDPPVIGKFENGVGVFEGDDHHDRTPVRVRFIWTNETPSTARWQQAFSADGGGTWETNWIMDFTRRDA